MWPHCWWLEPLLAEVTPINRIEKEMMAMEAATVRVRDRVAGRIPIYQKRAQVEEGIPVQPTSIMVRKKDTQIGPTGTDILLKGTDNSLHQSTQVQRISIRQRKSTLERKSTLQRKSTRQPKGTRQLKGIHEQKGTRQLKSTRQP